MYFLVADCFLFWSTEEDISASFSEIIISHPDSVEAAE